MRFGRLLPSDAWMRDGERRRFRAFVRRVVAPLEAAHGAEDPMLRLLVCDLGALLVYVERTEAGLQAEEEAFDETREAKALEAAGKARERMRKAMKELQDYSATLAGPAQGESLAERMMPILKRYPFIVEDVPQETSQNTTSGI